MTSENILRKPHRQVPATESAEDDLALVTKGTAAKAVSVSVRTLENLMSRRVVPFVRISPRCVRFNLKRVAEALEAYEVREVR